MSEPVARVFRTVAAKTALAFCAGAHLAVDACFGHILFGVFAAVAGIFFTQEGPADAAIHPTWSDQILGDLGFHLFVDAPWNIAEG